MKFYLTIAAAALLPVPAAAQINSPDARGYMTRAAAMLADRNYNGCLDQLDMMTRLNPEPRLTADGALLKAAAAYEAVDPEAESYIEEYLATYPESPWRSEMQLRLASLRFFAGDYAGALERFNAIDADALGADASDDLAYRSAFCRLKLGDYATAETSFSHLAGTSRYGNAAKFYLGYIAYTAKDYDRAMQLFDQVDQSTSPGDMADYYRAQIYYMRGDYGKAFALARPLAGNDTIDPGFRAEACRITGESLFNTGQDEKAIPYLREYVSLAETPLPSTRYMLGAADYRNGDYNKAIEKLGPVTSENNAIGQSAYLFIGQSYLKLGNNAAAVMALGKACAMDYDQAVTETAYYNYAVARMKGGKVPFGSSVATFEEFLRRYPSSRYASKVEEYIINGYMTDNDYESALKSIERISRPSTKILAAKQRVLFVLGTRDYSSGQPTRALERLNGSLKLASHDPAITAETYLWQGDCYYTLGQYANAEKAYRNYLSKAPRNAANRYIATYDLGYALFAQQKYSDARRQFEATAASGADAPTRADAYNRIADTYYYASDFARARENYDRSYSLNPEAGDYALFQQAMMLGLTKDYRGKLSTLDDVISRFPSSSLTASALLEKAQTYTALGNQSSAIAGYIEVTERFPNTSQGRNALLQLAITYRNAGDENRAVNAYRNVISRYPSSDEASVAADDLKDIYARRGDIEELDRFLSSIDGAPRLDAAEKSSLASQSLYSRATAAMARNDRDEALTHVTALVTRYPDSEMAEDALAMKADIEYSQGKTEMALADFTALESRASGAFMLHRARLGMLRAARDLGRDAEAIATADRLLASSAAGQAEAQEVKFIRACAYANTGDIRRAEAEWSQLAATPSDLYGSMSAYYLADRYFNDGKTDKALATVNEFIDANPPHHYWLARGFILLSDILRAQGNTFEADEYLSSLKANYPGKEIDIFEMIDTRLNK
ncbi:MAG: tetratricopeptide repeat protein [Muribaculaceae bacterium]|nr:tetratricopeptide repeat protein [Muribaculaceae bacterium]